MQRYIVIIALIGCSVFQPAFATRVFRRTITVTNALQFPISITDKNGAEKASIEPTQSAEVAMVANEPLRISAHIGNQDIAVNAMREQLDITWNVGISDDNTSIMVTKTQQKAGNYNPKPMVRPMP